MTTASIVFQYADVIAAASLLHFSQSTPPSSRAMNPSRLLAAP
jgi:hypothetical protein